MQTEDDSSAYQTVMLVIGAVRLLVDKWAVLARYLSGPLLLAILVGWLLGGLPREGGETVSSTAWPWLVHTLLAAYLILLSLRVLTGTRGPEVFSVPAPQMVNYFLASLFVWFLASLGFGLLLIPGLIVLAATIAWPLLVLEEGQRPVQALTNSLESIQGYLFDLVLAFIALTVTLALANWLLATLLVDTFLSARQYQVLAFGGSFVVGFYLAALAVMVYHRRPDLHESTQLESQTEAEPEASDEDPLN